MEDLICRLNDCVNELDDLEMEISEYGIDATELEKAIEIIEKVKYKVTYEYEHEEGYDD